MALTQAQAKSISNFFHYSLRNYDVNNDAKQSIIKISMNVIDTELKTLGGTVTNDPLSPY